MFKCKKLKLMQSIKYKIFNKVTTSIVKSASLVASPRGLSTSKAYLSENQNKVTLLLFTLGGKKDICNIKKDIC